MICFRSEIGQRPFYHITHAWHVTVHGVNIKNSVSQKLDDQTYSKSPEMYSKVGEEVNIGNIPALKGTRVKQKEIMHMREKWQRK